MKTLKILLPIIFCLLLSGVTSCKKYLDKKSDKTLIIPQSLADLQTLLDNYRVMNQGNRDYGELASDNVYMLPSVWTTDFTRNKVYVWDKEENASNSSWETPYQTVFYANIVLDALHEMQDVKSGSTYNDIKGQALTFRSFAFFRLAQLYSRPYSSLASTDLGIPLRLTSDINVRTVRSTVQQTYDQVIADLKEAANLLPLNTNTPERPSKTAVYGLLARVYLSMRDYVNAGKYADSALNIYNSLLDYNNLNSSASYPVPNMNPEVIFLTEGGSYAFAPNVLVDTVLYQSYNDNDLRKQVFFQLSSDGINHTFKGSYGTEINSNIFHGVATDELYLIRAECSARAGNKDAALTDLNTLVSKRWKSSITYPVITAIDANDALNKVLTERRKELVFRDMRWTDLRRLNLESANITLKRVISGTAYTLPPNDPRWVILIPSHVTSISGIEQNPR